MDKNDKKRQYFAHKKKLDELRDNITLKRWEILSKAYRLGKQIWGSRFTRARLAFDMDTPLTTTLRCLSLDRCNKRTWNLIKQKKISAFKVAQVTMSKNVTYQDEIVDMIIADNLSTTQISSLRVKNLKDINKERHRIACENGYSRKESAYIYFSKWIERGKIFMLMSKDNIIETKQEKLHSDLKTLKDMIESYLK